MTSPEFEVGEDVVAIVTGGIQDRDAVVAPIVRQTKTTWVVEIAGREKKFTKSTLEETPSRGVWVAPVRMRKQGDPEARLALAETDARRAARWVGGYAAKVRDLTYRGDYAQALAAITAAAESLTRCRGPIEAAVAARTDQEQS